MANPSSRPYAPCSYKGCRCYMRNSSLNSKEGIVSGNSPVTPCQNCQTVPSTPQNNQGGARDWCYETPQQIDKMWPRSKLGVRFQTPQFTPMKRFDFKVKPTPIPKEIPPTEPDTPTPVKCMQPPSPLQGPFFPPSAS